MAAAPVLVQGDLGQQIVQIDLVFGDGKDGWEFHMSYKLEAARNARAAIMNLNAEDGVVSISLPTPAGTWPVPHSGE